MLDLSPNTTPEERAAELLRAGAAAELKLLRAEQKAERRLAAARAAMARDASRAEKARRRLERRRENVTTAELALRESQTRRAVGPDWTAAD